MYTSFMNSIKTKYSPFFNTRTKVRLFILGFGCSQVYVTGTCVYLNVVNGLSEDSNNITGPVHHFYTSNIATHFSPYILPIFLRRGCMNNINKVLSNNQSTFTQRFYAYSALNKICSNINAINYLNERNVSNDQGVQLELNQNIIPFTNLLNSLVEPKKVMSINHQNNDGFAVQNEIDEPEMLFDQKIKSFENLLKNIKPQDRVLTYHHISNIVKQSNKYKSIQSHERLSNVLLLLLENVNNVKSVIENEFEEFSNFPIIKSSDTPNKYLTELCPVLSYLYLHRFKTNYINNVFSDKFYTISYNNDCISLINKELKKSFNSLPKLLIPLQHPLIKYYSDEIKTATILFQTSMMYSLIRGLFDSLSPGQSRLTSLRNGFLHGLKTFRGLALLELFLVLQRKIISSKFYFDNEKKKDAMIMSFLLSLASFGSMASIMLTQRYFFGPFLISRMAM